MDDALSTPLPGLTLLQRLLWPLIFVQLVALRDRLRAQYGCNMPCWLSISKFGRVRLIRIPTDFTFSQAAPVSYETFGHDYSAGLTRARLADVCAEEETPPAPRPALAFLMPRRNRGRPQPTPTRLKLICRPRIIEGSALLSDSLSAAPGKTAGYIVTTTLPCALRSCSSRIASAAFSIG